MDTRLVPVPPALMPAPRRPARNESPGWIIAGLLALGVVPLGLGIAHLVTVATGIDLSAKAAYFLAMPVPIALHVLGAAFYVLLGPLQFSAGLRRRAPLWHRWSGRALVVAGLLVAASAIWMTLTMPHAGGAGDLLLSGARFLFGSAMITAIGIGYTAIRDGNIAAHRRWMARAYAIGLGAGTQVPVLMLAEIIAGPPGELLRACLMIAAWGINLAVAEWALRRSRR